MSSLMCPTSRVTTLPSVLALLLAAATRVGAAPVAMPAQDSPPTTAVLKPGQVLEFSAADALQGSVDINDAPLAGNADAFLGTALPLDAPLNSFVCARQRLSRATAEIQRHNDFLFDGSWGPGTVVPPGNAIQALEGRSGPVGR